MHLKLSKSTLSRIDPKKMLKKPSLAAVLPVLAVISPVAVVGVLAATHPSEVKSTLGSIAKEVKKDVPIIASTLGKGVKSVTGAVGGAFDKMMLPIIIIGAIVAMSMLKK